MVLRAIWINIKAYLHHRWNAGGKACVGYEGDDPGTDAIVKAGCIVAFSSTTLYQSGPNATDKPRRGYLCQFTRGPLIDPETGKAKYLRIRCETKKNGSIRSRFF